MVKAYDYRNRTQALYESFKGATAIHPLSMTCHQLLDEFQEVHIAASEPSWALFVNNFDLDQIRCFSDFIKSGQYIKIAGNNFYEADDASLGDWLHEAPFYNFKVSMRFQMDSHAYDSADKLRRHFLSNAAEAPKSLATADATSRWLGVADVVTQYALRTCALVDESKGMTLAQAQKIRSMFSQIADTLFYVLEEIEMCGERDSGGKDIPDSFGHMEWRWFEPFYEALCRMEEAAEDADRASTQSRSNDAATGG